MGLLWDPAWTQWANWPHSTTGQHIRYRRGRGVVNWQMVGLSPQMKIQNVGDMDRKGKNYEAGAMNLGGMGQRTDKGE